MGIGFSGVSDEPGFESRDLLKEFPAFLAAGKMFRKWPGWMRTSLSEMTEKTFHGMS